MRKYEFTRESYSDEPGYEMEIYTSQDLNGKWMSERSCISAVILENNLAELEVIEVSDIYSLEALLLHHDIYVCFIEG